MIAFSCVHCGRQMRITEEEGSKKATCPKCGHVVMVPPGEGGVRPRRGLPGGSGSGERPAQAPPVLEPTQITRRPAPAGAETQAGASLGVHEAPTRVEGQGRPDYPLTSFLAPASAAD